MKKEQKKYMLVEYLGCETREYNNMEEYKELLNVIKKYNSKDKNPYLFGNVEYTKNGNKIVATIQKYHKLTKRIPISNIDDATFDMNEIDLINHFQNNIKTKSSLVPDINIAYLNDRDNDNKIHYDVKISYLPVLYKDDAKYLSKKYVMECIKYLIVNKDYDFFYDLIEKFSFYRVIEDDIDKLRYAISKAKTRDADVNYILDIVSKFYDHLVYERDGYTRVVRDMDGNMLKSHRRVRDFGIFVRDYAMLERKKSLPTKYNKKIKNNNNEEDYDYLSEEYALYGWDQENGNTYKGFEVEYDHNEMKYIRK